MSILDLENKKRTTGPGRASNRKCDGGRLREAAMITALALAWSVPAAAQIVSPTAPTPGTPTPVTPSTTQVPTILSPVTCVQQMDTALAVAKGVSLGLDAFGMAGEIAAQLLPEGANQIAEGIALGFQAAALVDDGFILGAETALNSEPQCDTTFAGTVTVTAGGVNVTGDSIFNGNVGVNGDINTNGSVNANQVHAAQGISAHGGNIWLGNPDGVSYFEGITLGGGALSGAGSGGALAFTAHFSDIAIGNGATALATDSIAFGSGATALATSSIAIGTGANTAGTSAIAIGTAATATGDFSTAVGNASVANNLFATAYGSSSVAVGTFSTATGALAVAASDRTTATGALAVAAGQNSTATGAFAVAGGLSSTATGYLAVAAGDFSTATGFGAVASGDSSIANGPGAVATGSASVAVGAGAVADGDNSMAYGTNASTGGFANSVAFGAGATTAYDNQQVFGTADETYTMPGITSQKSRFRQTGLLELPTTDAFGNLASDGGAVFKTLATLQAGTAVALALTPAQLTDSEDFGFSFGWGNHAGVANAMGFSAMGVLDRNMFNGKNRLAVTAGIGLGYSEFLGYDANATMSGRAAMQFTW